MDFGCAICRNVSKVSAVFLFQTLLMPELIGIPFIYFRKSFPSQHATLASFAAVYVSVSKSQSFRSIQALSIHCAARD